MSTLLSLSAFIASLIGGLTCITGMWFVIIWNTRRARMRRESLRRELQEREDLYEKFVNTCAKLMRDFMEDQMVAPDTLASVIAIINAIRITASGAVLKAAESALQNITLKYLENEMLTMDEKITDIRESTLRGADPLSEFSRVCREELWELHTTVG